VRKRRGEVKASGKKPYRQKGTGNARRGGNASPSIGEVGSVSDTPRDYSKIVPKKVRKLAFARALTARIEAGDVLTSGPLAVADGKTKNLVSAISKLTDATKVLVIGSFDEVTFRSAGATSNRCSSCPGRG